MSVPFNQKMAVSKLVGICEGLAASGMLDPETEMTVRLAVADALSAFNMPSKAERANPEGVSISDLDETLRAVSRAVQ